MTRAADPDRTSGIKPLLHIAAALTAAVLPLTVAAAVPARAATVLIGADGPTQALYQSWIDSALVPSADTRVVLHMQPCPFAAGWCMPFKRESGLIALWTDTDLGYLWTDADSHSERDRIVTKLTLLHEIGHVFDFSPGAKGYRRAFARVMRRTKDAWATAADNSLHEQFAQAYGLCAFYPHYADSAYARSVWPGYDYNPTPEQYERACYVIRNPSLWPARQPSGSAHRRSASTSSAGTA